MPSKTPRPVTIFEVCEALRIEGLRAPGWKIQTFDDTRRRALHVSLRHESGMCRAELKMPYEEFVCGHGVERLWEWIHEVIGEQPPTEEPSRRIDLD